MKLHLGCGKRYIPGFVHVDLDAYDHIDYQSPVDDLSMFQDETCSLVYASHVLEYFDRVEAIGVLKEWRRVLRPGGVLRLAVPDFDKLVEVYKITEDLSKVLGPLYGRIEINGSEGKRAVYHKTVYNFNSLKEMLEETGFRDVRRYDWRKTLHKDYDDYSQAYYPHMDKENGILISLNVECTR